MKRIISKKILTLDKDYKDYIFFDQVT